MTKSAIGDVTTYHKGMGDTYSRSDTFYLRECCVCGHKFEEQRAYTDWLTSFCEQHRDSAKRRNHAISSLPDYMKPCRDSLQDYLLHNHKYWIRKGNGIDVSGIESDAINALKRRGIPDSLIFYGWKE